ncbi:hypothetical protein [uncultured Kordia sp.]|uniref:hypothetical protein n=1 Tax=uncultured Kordia sp. TaxID=507699 RepID=UPI00261D78CF|nr:hypothetical protein [uncultured Kordia sp.]
MSADTISDQELIEKFLCGELLDHEKLIFDSRKKEEAFLALLETSIIAYKGRLSLKQTLKKIGKEVKSEKPKSTRKSVFWMSGIAASVLLFISIYFFSNQKLSSDELFTIYFKAYPNAYTTKGSTSNYTLSQKAFDFYDAAQYKLASKIFDEITAERTLNSSEHFYFGISLLYTDEIENAKMQFKKVVPEHPLYNEAQWYTSLSLIKQDSLTKAKSILIDKKSQFSTSRKNSVKNLLNELTK